MMELKPCPFCGVKPSVVELACDDITRIVQCMNPDCKATMSPMYEESWNQRVPDVEEFNLGVKAGMDKADHIFSESIPDTQQIDEAALLIAHKVWELIEDDIFGSKNIAKMIESYSKKVIRAFVDKEFNRGVHIALTNKDI